MTDEVNLVHANADPVFSYDPSQLKAAQDDMFTKKKR